MGSSDRYLGDYLVCAIVLLNFHCAGQAAFFFLEKWEKAIRNISSYTFTLYLVHVLVISMWQYYRPAAQAGWATALPVSLLIALATILVGLATEHRRAWLSSVLIRICDVAGRAAQLPLRLLKPHEK